MVLKQTASLIIREKRTLEVNVARVRVKHAYMFLSFSKRENDFTSPIKSLKWVCWGGGEGRGLSHYSNVRYDLWRWWYGGWLGLLLHHESGGEVSLL